MPTARLKRRTALTTLALVATSAGMPLGAQTPTVIRLGMVESPAAPSSLAAMEFKRLAEAESKGRLQVQVYTGGQLGSVAGVASQVKSGSIQMAGIAIDYLTSYYPDLGIFGLLFLFPSRASAYRALDGKLGDAIKRDVLAHTGVRMLGIGDFGYKCMMNRKGPIHDMNDLKGLKMRVIPNPIAIDSFKALGVNPSNVDFNEEYTAIQQGVIDGGELPIPTMLAGKFEEVAPYISVTNHNLTLMPFYMNEAFYQSLPPDLQKVVGDAGTKAALFDRKASVDMERSSREELISKGTKFNDVAAAEIAKMKATQQPVYEHAKTIGPQAAEWLQQLLALK